MSREAWSDTAFDTSPSEKNDLLRLLHFCFLCHGS